MEDKGINVEEETSND